ncbi:GNAT family N-acetyltransferase [Streptomyces chryseus]
MHVRELAKEDASALAEIWGDPATVPFMAFEAMTRKQIDAVIERATAEAHKTPRTEYLLAATGREGGELIGTLALTLQPHRSVYIHSFSLRKELWRTGLSAEISLCALRLSFEELGAHRAWCTAHRENIPAQRVALAAGMSHEGVIRDFFFTNGAWQSVNAYSILESEWFGP